MIPYSYVSYCDHNPAEGRWDQFWLDRFLQGVEYRLPGGFQFEKVPYEVGSEGRILIFPASHYAECEHCLDPEEARALLTAEVWGMDWAIIFATSDECQLFPWRGWDPGDHVRLWVQTPKPDRQYPEFAEFFPLGSPRGDRLAWLADGTRDIDREHEVFFSGQGGHELRDRAIDALLDFDFSGHVSRTEGFTKGMRHDDYEAHLLRTQVAPAPSGPCTPDTFRFYEALDAGCVPIRDGDTRFWQLLQPHQPFHTPVVQDWERSRGWISAALGNWGQAAASASAWWKQERRRLAGVLHDQILEVSGERPASLSPDDEITVLMPTSPIPSHPDPGVLLATLASVRERLPHAEIIIMCDGVREEQEDRHDDYWEAVRRVCLHAAADPSIVPLIFPAHRHQSGMTRKALELVRTPHIMFVEHDTPLEGDIPFEHLLNQMDSDELAMMRLYHETEIQPGSEHLWLDGGDDWKRTLQWSQRPHIASTAWYRDIMATYFGLNSRTMIEDVMHGVVQSGLPPYYDTLPDESKERYNAVAEALWKKWRLAIYTPPGSWKRSGHLDGREGDPKYEMYVAYDGERPKGAPEEGTL